MYNKLSWLAAANVKAERGNHPSISSSFSCPVKQNVWMMSLCCNFSLPDSSSISLAAVAVLWSYVECCELLHIMWGRRRGQLCGCRFWQQLWSYIMHSSVFQLWNNCRELVKRNFINIWMFVTFIWKHFIKIFILGGFPLFALLIYAMALFNLPHARRTIEVFWYYSALLQLHQLASIFL